MRIESLRIFERVATEWLSRRGRCHPNLWGIVALTYWSYVIIPAGRAVGDGRPLTVDARVGIQLRAAANPFYTGKTKLVLTPAVIGA